MLKKSKGQDWSRYTRLTTDSKHRIVAASYGEVGTLKTSLWLTAPAPIVIQSTDFGLEGVVDVYLKKLYEETGIEKEIYVIEYDPTVVNEGQDEAVAVRDKFEEDAIDAITKARTLLWDKETHVYEIFKYAEFGAPSDQPSNYYALDQRYRHLINMVKQTDLNFGLIQSMKEAWKPTVKASGAKGATGSGQRVRRGFREIEELVHINLEHVLSTDDEGNPAFFLNIGKSRGPGGQDIQNTTIPYVTFPDLAQLVFPDSDPSEWV